MVDWRRGTKVFGPLGRQLLKDNLLLLLSMLLLAIPCGLSNRTVLSMLVLAIPCDLSNITVLSILLMAIPCELSNRTVLSMMLLKMLSYLMRSWKMVLAVILPVL